MRRATAFLAPSVLIGLAASVALASDRPVVEGTFEHAETDNVTVDGHTARIETVEVLDSTDQWYRARWNDSTWQVQLQKSDADHFSASDTCLPLALNPDLTSVDPVDVHGVDMRLGPNAAGTSARTLPSGAIAPMPSELDYAEGLYLLTRGADGGATELELTWLYADGSTSTSSVEILDASVSGATRDRAAKDGAWQVFGWSGLATSGGCHDGADLLYVSNPNPERSVASVRVDYADTGDVTLAGPLALSIATDEQAYDATYSYRGTLTSTALDAGADALWYEISWSETLHDSSELAFYVSCSDDAVEWQAEDGPFSSWLGDNPGGTRLSEICDGRYVRYRVVFTSEYERSPELDGVSLYFEPDQDRDGYGSLGYATQLDCDDTRADIHPDAFDACGDGVDATATASVAPGATKTATACPSWRSRPADRPTATSTRRP